MWATLLAKFRVFESCRGACLLGAITPAPLKDEPFKRADDISLYLSDEEPEAAPPALLFS